MLRDPRLVPLSHHHQHGLALCVLTGRELDADESPENVARLARRAVDHYEMELTNHFAIEEQILFPACRAEMTAPLVAEHRQLENMINTLRTAPTPAALREFTSLLRSHIRAEENQLFETAQREIPAADLDRIGAEIGRRAVKVCL
jgi:hemerythrin-like domain-containing protein